jgi:hypothetical protein
MTKEQKLRVSAMRMAQRVGVNPYDSALTQGRKFETLVRLQLGRVKSESDANRLLARR